MAQIEKVAISMCGSGKSFENKPCLGIECNEPVWSTWSQWSICSKDCKQYRRRYCPTEGQEELKESCQGSKFMSRNCNNSECNENYQYMINSNGIKYDVPLNSQVQTKSTKLNDRLYGMCVF